MLMLDVHVAISLAALVAGAVVVQGLLRGQNRAGWTVAFLWITALTCVTGFFLPIPGFTPAVGTAVAALVVVALGAYALYSRRLARGWRTTFVVSMVIAEYFSALVLVAQAFKHVGILQSLAPQGNEPPVAITQAVVLFAFIAIAIFAIRRFRT